MAIDRKQLERRVEFMEKQGASQAEVQEYINSLKQPKQEEPAANNGILSRAAKNFIPSSFKVVSDTVTALIHPVKTVKGISKLAVGLAKKALPGTAEKTESVQVADAVIDFYKNRYGSLEKAKETFAEDPAGFLMDASTFITGTSGLAKAGLNAGRLSKAAKVAGTIEKIGQSADIVSQTAKVAGKVAKTATTRLAPKLDMAAEMAAKTLGVELTAGMKTKSRIVPALEAFSERTLLGGGKMTDRVDLAKSQVQAATDSIISHAGPNESPAVIGKELIKASDSFHDNWVKAKNKLYDEASLPPGSWIKPESTKSFIDQIVKDRKQATNIIGSVSKENPYETILSNLIDDNGNLKNVKLRDFQSAIKQLNTLITNSTDPVVTGNKASLKKLVSVMSDEFDARLKEVNPNISDKLDAANAYYKSGLDVMNSSIGKTVEAYRNDPSQLVGEIVKKSTSVEDISRLTEMVGEDLLPKIRRVIMSDIIESAKKAGGESGDFKATGLAQGIKKYGDKLDAVFTPEQVKEIKDLDTVIKAINRTSAGKGLMDSVAIATISGKVSAFSSMLVTHPLSALSMLVGDIAASRFISSDLGQKVLTTGTLVEKMPMINGKLDVSKALEIMRQAAFQEGRMMNDGIME